MLENNGHIETMYILKSKSINYIWIYIKLTLNRMDKNCQYQTKDMHMSPLTIYDSRSE